MMDFNSPEFYTIAFVVAMALIALLMGKREKQPPSTHIVQLDTTPCASEDDEDVVTIEALDGGKMRISRSGIMLATEETANLVITIQEDHCSIVEKKGVRRRHADRFPVAGQATVKCFKPGAKYRLRYESQLTSAWATFTLDTSSPHPTRITLRY